MIKAFIFDLDGTLYLGEEAIDGAVDTVFVLEERNYRVFYLTNNSGKTQQQIVHKLNRMGFGANPDNTYCGSYAISAYLTQNKITPVYVIGTEELKNDLVSRNIDIKDNSFVSAVVVGIDPFFSYGKIVMALEAINKGAKLIVANTDVTYPVENNRRLPGCGAMVAAIVAAANHAPDFHVGKPNTYLLELLCREHGFSSQEICVVGDMPESDIAMADNFQCQSILFDPKGAFPDFSGKKVKKLHKIISLIKKGRMRKWQTATLTSR